MGIGRRNRLNLVCVAVTLGAFWFIFFRQPAQTQQAARPPLPNPPPPPLPQQQPPDHRPHPDDDNVGLDAKFQRREDTEELLPAEQGLDEGVIEVPGFDAKAKIFPGASPQRLHGNVGLKPDGTPGIPLQPVPPKGNMAQYLRGNGFHVKLSDSISLDRDGNYIAMPLDD